jgi:hypothetical protein
MQATSRRGQLALAPKSRRVPSPSRTRRGPWRGYGIRDRVLLGFYVKKPGRSLPTNVSSPRSTLINYGSVSIRVRRRNRCTRLTPRPGFTVVRNSSASIHRPLRQIRSRRRNTGPPLLTLMATATAVINGSRNPAAKHARRASKTRQQRTPPRFRIATILSPMGAGLSQRKARTKCLKDLKHLPPVQCA